MSKPRPTIGQQDWGNVLNDHLGQLMPAGGGINSGVDFPPTTNLVEGYVFVKLEPQGIGRFPTGFYQWNGLTWLPLLEAPLNKFTSQFFTFLADGVVIDERLEFNSTPTYPDISFVLDPLDTRMLIRYNFEYTIKRGGIKEEVELKKPTFGLVFRPAKVL